MSYFDTLYYVAFAETDPGTVALKPDQQTSGCYFESTPQVVPGRPFHFSNGFKDEMAKSRVTERITDIMFAGPYFMVSDRVYQLLADFEIADLQYYPAVYESDTGDLHDYWFLIFDGSKDRSWYDRQQSVLDDDDDREDDDKPFVERYVLDENRIRAFPEEQRLMFRMTGVMEPLVFVHERVVTLLSRNRISGIQFSRVCDYED